MLTGTYLRTKEHKEKLSLARKGKHFSSKTEIKKGQRLSPVTEFKKGHIPWNKGKIGIQVGYWRGKKRPDISDAQKGKQFLQETRRKMSKVKIGKKPSLETRMKMSESSKRVGSGLWMRGRKIPRDTVEKIRLANLGQKRTGNYAKGERNGSWQNGKSFEPYGLEFNEYLREVIRNRDRRKCFLCEKTELENNRKLEVHHCDYNKQNNNPNNLISLCRNCHTKTNFNRKYWTNYFQKI